MTEKNLLSLLGIEPLVRGLVDYIRNWSRDERVREAQTQTAEALARRATAEALRAEEEARSINLRNFSKAIEIAQKTGLLPEISRESVHRHQPCPLSNDEKRSLPEGTEEPRP